MKNIYLKIVILFLIPAQLFAQAKKHEFSQPKLVVGIVVDQMRADYIYRYWNKFQEGGFKKLVGEGFYCANTHYNYVPTYTGPGHASIYTGTTPEYHGIIGNNWYVRSSESTVYCASDTNQHSVGGSEKSGQMSPSRLIGTTIGDELRLFSGFRSKVIGVSLKDRGAIFPAGHSGKAFWFDNITNNFISSTYYYQREKGLPVWLSSFNDRKLAEKFLNGKWEPLLSISDYTESTSDDTRYEYVIDTIVGAKPILNYDLKRLSLMEPDLLRRTPFGNTITMEMAVAAINGEKLGDDSFCDLLAVSFSSTDYVGHAFGTDAVETEDTYLRLDKDLATFIKYLEEKIGKDNVLVFLTADHAALPNPLYLNDHKIPGGFVFTEAIKSEIKKSLQAEYGDSSLFSYYINDQVFLNNAQLEKSNLLKDKVAAYLSKRLLDLEFVADVILSSDLISNDFSTGIKGMVRRGFNRKRSGDIAIIYQPGFIESHGGRQAETGTTHGSPYNYDTHVPVYWWGWKIKHGITHAEVNINDIAPSIAALLNICQPSGCTGKPIIEITK